MALTAPTQPHYHRRPSLAASHHPLRLRHGSLLYSVGALGVGLLLMNTEDLYRLLRIGHVQAQGIVDTVADPLLVLDESLCIQNASRSFFQTFKVDRDETIGQRIYDLGNGQWNIPELRRLLTDVIPKASAVIDYEVE